MNEIKIQLDNVKSSKDKYRYNIYMESLARTDQLNKLIILYRNNIDSLIPCHLGIIEGYTNIRLYFKYNKPNIMIDELELIDTYFDPNDKLIVNLLLNKDMMCLMT